MKLQVECNTCHDSVITENGTDPDGALSCKCCEIPHNHGQSANETGVICRPVTISMVNEPGTTPAVIYFG